MADGAGEFIETERKYEAAARFALPDLAGLDGVAAVTGPQTYRLRAIYFDTADFRLLAAKITLRRRTGGMDAGWHLKLPAGVDTRREVHAPLGRDAGRVPGRLAELVAGWTGGARPPPPAPAGRGGRGPAGSGAGAAGRVRCSGRSPTTWWSAPCRPPPRQAPAAPILAAPECRSGGRRPAGARSRSSWSPGRVSCWTRLVR